MKVEPSVRRHLCLWLPEPLPPTEAEHQRKDGRRCAGKREPQRERLEAFALWCQQFSPQVSIERGPDERGIEGSTLLLDLTGLGPLFGGEQELVKKVIRALGRRHVKAHLGLADSIGASWALAHFGRVGTAVGSGGHQDSAITLRQLPPRIAPLEALQALPVAALRLAPQATESLALLGIHSVGQLATLPRKQLTARFGKEVLQRLDQVAGNLEELLQVLPPPEETTVEWILEFPTVDRSLLKAIFQQLVDRLQQILVHRSHIPLGITCRLKLQNRTEEQLTVSLYHACGDVPHLAELLGLRLERITLAAPVSDIFLTVTESTRQEHHQLAWCDLQRNAAAEKRPPQNPFASAFERCLERLRCRLGPQAVVQPQLRTDAIPERSVRWIPRARRQQKRGLKKTLLFRPLWLRRPQRIEVVECDQEDLPLEFNYLGDRHTVRLLEGPERIESSWHSRHRTRSVCRDYYRVETSTRQRFWIFHHRRNSAWFLHGEFD